MKFRNVRLAKTYDYCGSDKPKLTVIMIHGIASDSTTFSRLLKHLEKIPSLQSVRFVTFDLLGSGKSAKGPNYKYDYNDQLTALRNSIRALKTKTPLVLVGHSLGTFIVTRYASKYKKRISRLILISSPIYTVDDLNNPAFMLAIKAFKDAVAVKNRKILKDRAFNNSMEYIVMNHDNYETLAKIKVPTDLICGREDKIIASRNLPKILKDNPRYISLTKTRGKHSITPDKYEKVDKILEEEIDA